MTSEEAPNPCGKVRVSVLVVGVVVGLLLLAGIGIVDTARAASEAPVCSEVTIAGSGTDEDPFQVATLEQLQCIGEAPGTSLGFGDNYELQSDIDASETATWNDGAGFDPIGSSDEFFYSTFDGNGYTISNLHIDRPDTERVGLFARLYDLRIGNVSLESTTITGGNETGGLVGYNEGGTVSNASVDGEVNGNDQTGGLVGANTGVVTDSSATARVDGSGTAGGLVGYSFDTVSNSSAAGSVTGSERVGGLVGYSRGDVSRSAATGDADGSEQVGGLVGNSRGTVTESHASGDATGDSYVGGFVGINGVTGADNGDVSESYATGSVTGDRHIGGFVGDNNGEITDAYAAGEIVKTGGDVYVGGFTGNNDDGTITGTYWDSERSDFSTGVGESDISDGPGDVIEVGSTTDMQGSTSETQLSDLFDSGSWASVAGDYPDLVTNPRQLSTPHYDDPTDAEMATILDDMAVDGDGYGIVTSDKALQAIGRNSTTRSDDYRLGLDIDASGTDGWNSGTGWYPLGFGGTQFSGSFDGDGHAVSDLYIDRAADTVGLFGSVTEASTIERVGVESANVSGNARVGGLVGESEGGIIRESHVTGTVDGADSVGGLIGWYEISTGDGGGVNESYAAANVTGEVTVGGLIGNRDSAAPVNGSYATGSVDGDRDVGGLIGYNQGPIRQTYATGSVDGTEYVGGLVGRLVGDNTVTESYATGSVTGGTTVGGLVGRNEATVTDAYAIGRVTGTDAGGAIGITDGGTVESVYWNTETTEQSESAGSEIRYGLTTEAMTGLNATVGLFEFDFRETWQPSATPGSYPVLASDSEFADRAEAFDGLVDGDGSASSPYRISTAYELQFVSVRLGEGDSFELVDDIDASGTDGWFDRGAGPRGFDPIGNAKEGFNGTFDGSGYVIANVSINRSNANDVGLFGYVESNGNVSALHIESANVTGSNDVGGLVGVNGGTVNGSSIGGEIDGAENVGGLIGRNDGGTVTASSSTGQINGSTAVGGLAGIVESGTVDASAATGEVQGDREIGGLVGRNGGVLNASYATGSVNGTSQIGGLVGYTFSTVRGSYATGAVNGTNVIGGLVGSNSDAVNASYATGSVNGTRQIGGLVGRNDGVVRESSAAGAVDGVAEIGGLVGNNVDTVRASSATGGVNGRDVDVGGLVGLNDGSVAESFATGRVIGGDTDIGGLVGRISHHGIVEDSYWDRGTTNRSVAVGSGTGTNLTGFGTPGDDTPSPEMQGPSAVDYMSNLSFATTWSATDAYPLVTATIDALNLTLAADNVTAGESTDANVTLTLIDNATTVGATTTSEYSSNDTSVATADTERVRATGAGTALLTAELGGRVDSATLSVRPAPSQPTSGGGGSRPELELRVTDDETIEATDGRAGETVRITSETTGDAESLDPSENVAVDGLSIGLANDRDFWVDVETFERGELDTNESESGDDSETNRSTVAAAFETETGTVSVGYVTITHNLDPDDIESVEFEFSVRQSYLDDLGVETESVTLYRQSEEWSMLSTEYVGESEERYQFTATSPGFSSFAIGTGAAVTAVTDATLAADEITEGDAATVTATVENRGKTEAEHTIELSANGETVTTETIELNGGETVETTLSFEPAVGEYDLSVSDHELDSLVVTTPPTETPPPETTTVGVEDDEGGISLGVVLLVLVGASLLFAVVWRRGSRWNDRPE